MTKLIIAPPYYQQQHDNRGWYLYIAFNFYISNAVFINNQVLYNNLTSVVERNSSEKNNKC